MMEYKGYNIESDGAYGLRRIKSIGSGALPNQLKGQFTNDVNAMKVIDLYLATKEVKNGKETSAGRG